MITVIDYGMGNIRSVVKAIELYTADVRVSSDPASIAGSTGLIMPGDGAFGRAMENLSAAGWVGPLLEYIGNGGFFLGICLGYQLLFSSSDEFGYHKGLDVVPGHVKRFGMTDLKVPHMGWNQVDIIHPSPFLDGVPDRSHFYFIHSFYPEIADQSWVIGRVEYGITFPCIVGKGHCIATQFHPEKSHRVGLRIIENFVRNVCS